MNTVGTSYASYLRRRYPRKYGNGNNAKLRDTPASDYEISCMIFFRERGTSPGNPTWYKLPRFPEKREFVPNQSAITPLWTRLTAMKILPLTYPGTIGLAEAGGADKYIAEFEQLNGLKPCGAKWIKTNA